jgi:ribonuclease HII
MLSIGIDEAGYGPLLGPLVVSAVAMTLPDDRAEGSLWKLFPKGLTDQVKNAGGRIIIADSKKVYRGNTREIRELERSTLAGITLAGLIPPQDFTELVKAISLETDPHLHHPWYSHRSMAIPCRVEPAALKLSVGMLNREMANIGAKVVALKSVPLVEKRYNYLVQQTRNKSEVVFSQTVRLITEILKISQEKRVTICVDKQGGKDCYVRNLLRAFPDAQLAIKMEGSDESAYTLTVEGRSISIHFCKKGETRHLLIAWASIVSKYLRELFMHQFNAYWHAMDPTLEDTAGYWEDGLRFMKAIEPLLKKANISPDELIRQL